LPIIPAAADVIRGGIFFDLRCYSLTEIDDNVMKNFERYERAIFESRKLFRSNKLELQETADRFANQ
jgi:hypothetical protein